MKRILPQNRPRGKVFIEAIKNCPLPAWSLWLAGALGRGGLWLAVAGSGGGNYGPVCTSLFLGDLVTGGLQYLRMESATESHSYPALSGNRVVATRPAASVVAFLEDGVPKPFLLAMTAAGQSALNVKGLDTVIIDDTRFGNIIERGKNVLTRMHLGANEILQMAGRVHGRVEGGKPRLDRSER